MKYEDIKIHNEYMSEVTSLFNLINEKLNVEPILIGKLSLQEYYNYYMNADKIEFLLPHEYMEGDKKIELIEVLSKNGYKITDDKTFVKGKYIFIYDSFDKYKDSHGIDLEDSIRLFDMPRKIRNSSSEIICEAASIKLGYYILDIDSQIKIYNKNDEILNFIKKAKEESKNRKIECENEKSQQNYEFSISELAYSFYYEKKFTDEELDIILENKAKEYNKTKDETISSFKNKLSFIEKEYESNKLKNNSEVIEIVADYASCGCLKQTKFKDNKIIHFNIDLSIGDLSDLKHYSRNWLSNLYSKNVSYSFKEEIEDFNNCLKNAKKVRIWCSHKDADEYLLMLYICNLIENSNKEIYVIYSDEYKEECNSIGCMSYKEVNECEAHKLTKEEIQKNASIWKRLETENSDIRFIDKNGDIKSVSFEYFDEKILKTLERLGEVEFVHLVCALMVNFTINNMGDPGYSYLIERLISKEKIEVIIPGEKNYKVINYNRNPDKYKIIKVKY